MVSNYIQRHCRICPDPLAHAAVSAAALMLASGVALADLTGTTTDVTVSHTGQFGFTAVVSHTYGGTTTIVDPGAPAFSFDLTSPAPGSPFANSVELDFSNFAYGDFAGETGTIRLEMLNEEVDGVNHELRNENGDVIGTLNATGTVVNGRWAVDDVLSAGTGTKLVVGWESLGASPPPFVQPAMGEPLFDLTIDELMRFETGKVDFEHNFSVEEGLGPVFNKESCANCHNVPIGGSGSQTVTRFGISDKGGFDGLPNLGGSLLQAQAISIECQETLPAGSLVTAFRVTPSLLGSGLIQAIPDGDIQFIEANPTGGVSGVAHLVEAFEEPGVQRVGKFGWKAQVPTMLTFAADAGQNEIGLTNRFIPFDNDPNGDDPPTLGLPDNCDTVADPEDGPDGNGLDFIDRVDDFQRFIANPPQTPKSGMAGEAIFISVGCTNCHTQSFTTSNDAGLEDAIRNRTIQPYSDFLLHDAGLNADFIAQGAAGERELRTPPLWGIRMRDPVWHDGRFGGGTFADRMTLAILAHDVFGSEGAPSAQAYDALTPTEKDQVIAFLDSLGRREFDADGDNDVQLDDFIDFAACQGGGPYTPDDPCAVHDLDQDGDVDLDDYAGFITVYSGPMDDCNTNTILDITDIAEGTSLDTNQNGVPDECECVGDLTGDSSVGFSDLNALLANWGPCPGCDEDLNGDGTVGFSDLNDLLANWGPC